MAHPFLVGLVGDGVGPSLTPPMHMAEARAQGLDYVYRTIDLPTLGLGPADVGEVLAWARRLGYDALNVTHPCKQAVLPHLDEVDPRAAALGAVNTVVLRDGRAVGHNTDVTGFATGFATGLPDAATDEVVQLGAGGAGSAVADALLGLGVGHLVVVDVDPGRAGVLAHDLSDRYPGARVEAAEPAKLSALLPDTDGLVHCTPTGMAAHPGLPLDADLLHARLWVADIVYRPLDTALLLAARANGCRVLDGGHMAVHQAVDAFRLITGTEPDPVRMLDHFRSLADSERSPRGENR
ncbi:shikimate dehydrogenase (NADP(+)) [Marmoricola endophyticus]|uniref:Shikimate dehydrogenase (NADP(+)) n=1 Tax=Marmoricola endophyticus TaxID=2040280 RepID=A0A917BER1_9ACTN|nr:shikimate dehydrogenase [Marmoricola endophyticus]GGF39953.1 shikimate dehydrogenase (NADP(+)) [Marmoricola endophyticus]